MLCRMMCQVLMCIYVLAVYGRIVDLKTLCASSLPVTVAIIWYINKNVHLINELGLFYVIDSVMQHMHLALVWFGKGS